MDPILKRVWAAGALAASLAIAGCGLPGAPLPPSLHLPERVTDLSAARSGNQVSLAWTMPKRTTDKVLLKGAVHVRICRRQSASAPCTTAATLDLAPGVAGSYAGTLPPDLAAGSPRVLTWFVELLNSKGRSAGLSNPAPVLAGQAPPPLTGLTAQMAKDGVILRWNPAVSAGQPSPTPVRILRRLLSPPAAKPRQGLLNPPAEPLEQTLLVPAGVPPGRALDKDIRFGQTYEYRAQRVVQIALAGQAAQQNLELAGALSPPLTIHAVNVFPPATPTGLAAIANPAANGEPASIDLSWQPDTSPNLAGYIVYRREASTPWQRISPAAPVVGPAFHDAHVEPGHTYQYAVTAVGIDGLESPRSAEAQESVPTQ